VQPGLYVLSGRSTPTGSQASNYQQQKASVTGSWRVNESLELRGTVNPNYAETEPDQPVLRYGQAFAPQLIERRQFLARSSDLLQTPGIALINTRSIGRPQAALAGEYRQEGWRGVGLWAKEEADAAVLVPGSYGNSMVKAPASTSALFRGSWSAASADAGVLMAQRSYDGGGDNALAALDGLQRFDGGYNAKGLMALSQSSACAGSDRWTSCDRRAGHVARLNWGRARSLDSFELTYMEISPKFRSDLGWISQSGVRSYEMAGLKLIENIYPGIGKVELRPKGLMNRDWEGRTIQQTATLETGVHTTSSLWQLTVAPASKERLAANGKLFDNRWAEALLLVSPGVMLSHVVAAVKVGELPDYYNGQAGRGHSALLELNGALAPDWGFALTALEYKTRAQDGMAAAGHSYREGVLQGSLNWQYAALSRWRYVMNRNKQQGQDFKLAQPFTTWQRAQSLLWEHAPKSGWRTAVALTHLHTQEVRTLESLLKLAYFF